MSRTPRSEVFESAEVGVYHVYNRVVRRCFLCGVDPVSGKDFSYRKSMIVERLRSLAECFAIDIMSYAILANHFHLVLRNRPDLVQSWDDHEVARRWLMICPEKREPDGSPVPPTKPQIQSLVADPKRITQLRGRLSNPSWLMARACQHIARRCNKEDEQSGKFFGERFKMKRLLDEAGVLACMAYVDLNPIRAGLADTLDGYGEVSIGERMRAMDGSPADPSQWLADLTLDAEVNRQPVQVVGGPADKAAEADVSAPADAPARQTPAQPVERLGCVPLDLGQYLELLGWLAVRSRPELNETIQHSREGGPLLRNLGLEASAFADVVDHYERRFFTAVGCPASVQREATRRGRRWVQAPGREALRAKHSAPVPA